MTTQRLENLILKDTAYDKWKQYLGPMTDDIMKDCISEDVVLDKVEHKRLRSLISKEIVYPFLQSHFLNPI